MYFRRKSVSSYDQWSISFFFFFQAEDGIRDLIVTGVQTCALPICPALDDQSPAASAIERGKRAAENDIAPPGTIQGRTLIVYSPARTAGSSSFRDRKSVV